MAMRYGMGESPIQSKPKKTRQGNGTHTKVAVKPGNRRSKRYRGQGKG